MAGLAGGVLPNGGVNRRQKRLPAGGKQSGPFRQAEGERDYALAGSAGLARPGSPLSRPGKEERLRLVACGEFPETLLNDSDEVFLPAQ